VRVALLTDDWRPTGGVASHVRLVAPALAAAGHQVLVVHAGDAREHAGDRPVPGVTVQGVLGAFRDYGRRANTAVIPPVLAALREFGADIAHVHSNTNPMLERAVHTTLPTLKTIHALDLCPSGTKFHFATAQTCRYQTGPMCLPRQVYLRCTLSRRPQVVWRNYRRTREANARLQMYPRVIVASEFVRQLAVTNGVASDQVTVIPYFTHAPDTVEPSRSRTVLFVGRVTPEKGVELLIDAMRTVPGAWQLVIVGDGMSMPRVRRAVVAAGLTDRVTFRGWLNGDALAQAYREAAVVVVPSRWPEPFGIVGIEAMAQARPVVAFRTGGIPEWLHEGDGGHLVPPGDVSALAAGIGALLEAPEDAARLAMRGRARVIADYSDAAHLARLIPVYADVQSTAR